jgi:hypothetical protein
MRYEQAKPLVETLMNLAVLYHGAPSMLRHKMYEALDEYLPDLDEGCRTRGCIAVDHFKEKPDNLDNMSSSNKRPLKEYP